MLAVMCLASVVYFEARGEPIEGQYAVAEVVMNRVESDLFPDDVCSVARQRSQFAPQVRAGSTMHDTESEQRALVIAVVSMIFPTNYTDGAEFFHNRSVRPSWANRFEETARIGPHIFYRSS